MAANYGNSGSLLFAGFWARLAAYFVDCAIIVIISLAIAVGSSFAGEEGMLIGSIANLLVNLLYWPVLESSSRQATFGKSIVGIQVIDLNGNRVSFLRAFFRNLAKIISAIPLCIGFLLAAFTSRKQALHDIITDSLVVSTGSSGFFKALLAAVAGLVVAVGASGAYVYFNYLPQMEEEFGGAVQEILKSQPDFQPDTPTVVRPAVQPVVRRPPVTSAVPAVSAAAAASAVSVTAAPAVVAVPKVVASKPTLPVIPSQPISMAPVKVVEATSVPPRKQNVEAIFKPVKPKSPKPKYVPKKPKYKPAAAQPIKMDSEPDVHESAQRSAPLLPEILPDPGVAVSPILEPSPPAEPVMVVPKYNDMLTAVLRGDKDAVKQLLDMGRWVDKPGSSGMTPLMGAVMNHDAEMVKLLLEHGAEPSSQALKQARKNKDAASVLLLERNGAR